ncbi:hypothetical protein C8Q80DRAFT_1139208 [Daedaleopsis nitida]|nr:hypothetical protein C8Q80DRAFT_1139208 [Daedaleopsis nitida]
MPRDVLSILSCGRLDRVAPIAFTRTRDRRVLVFDCLPGPPFALCILFVSLTFCTAPYIKALSTCVAPHKTFPLPTTCLACRPFTAASLVLSPRPSYSAVASISMHHLVYIMSYTFYATVLLDYATRFRAYKVVGDHSGRKVCLSLFHHSLQ